MASKKSKINAGSYHDTNFRTSRSQHALLIGLFFVAVFGIVTFVERRLQLEREMLEVTDDPVTTEAVPGPSTPEDNNFDATETLSTSRDIQGWLRLTFDSFSDLSNAAEPLLVDPLFQVGKNSIPAGHHFLRVKEFTT
jgi:hypothetical protein